MCLILLLHCNSLSVLWMTPNKLYAQQLASLYNKCSFSAYWVLTESNPCLWESFVSRYGASCLFFIHQTTDSWLYSYSHKSTANQGLSTSKSHRNTRTRALNPKHGQADHLPWSRQDLLARISLTYFQLNWHLLAHRQKKILTDCCYFSVNPICSIPSNLLCTLPAIVNLRHTWHLIFSCCHLPSVVM